MPPHKKTGRRFPQPRAQHSPGQRSPGSRSSKHRGYRPDPSGADQPGAAQPGAASAKKARWTSEDHAARGRAHYGARDDRAGRDDRTRSERPNWEPRGKDARRTDREWQSRDRAGSRPRWDREDRPHRDSADRPRWDREERPRREWDAPRGDGADRPRRDASERSRGGTERSRGAGERFRGGSERFPGAGERSSGGWGDRPRRHFDERARGDRNTDARSADRPRRDWDDRRPPRDFDDRPRHDSADRPRRNSSDGPRRDSADRPRRDFADRSRRDWDDRPRRDFDDRPRRDSSAAPHSAGLHSAGSRLGEDVVLERLEAAATRAEDIEGVTFAGLGLGDNIVRALADLGAERPFPIQAATTPDVLAGSDVLGRGRTGSGKTIAFGAPLVERLMQLWASRADAQGKSGKRQLGRAPRALILAPTRELALQLDRTVQPIARSVGLFTTQIYGGVPQARQVGALQRGVDIVIGTPGRIEDLVDQGRLDLSEVVISVLDEADHMCDLGFLEPVQRILRQTAPGGQKLLFSATLDTGVARLVDEFLVDPAVHEVAGEDQASSTIDHRVLVIEHRHKSAIIEELADRDGKTLIFSRTRAFAEMLADQLDDAGIPAVSLHGDLNQSRRTRNLGKLTSGRVSVLVATDVAARGIHVDDIDLVIQADAPDEYKTYLHRAGRTGRAGKQGTVVTLIPKQRQRRMSELLGRAEIEADFVSAAPGDDVLLTLTQR